MINDLEAVDVINYQQCERNYDFSTKIQVT